jgi:alpha-galactosidase
VIEIKENVILLSTEKTSLLLNVNEVNKVTSDYYGPRLFSIEEAESLVRKYPYNQGDSITYCDEKPGYCLDHMKLVSSTLGKGDFFSPSLVMENEEGNIFDFVYDSAEVIKPTILEKLPTPHGAKEELVLRLVEKEMKVMVELHYQLFEGSDVIASYTKVINQNDVDLILRKASSLQLPLLNRNYEVWSTYGNWAGELNIEKKELFHGRTVIESLCGSSSNRHNPFFLLKTKDATYTQGEVLGFNLMYSSNFEDSIEMDSFDDVRVQVGLSSQGFAKVLKKEEAFETPIAIMTISLDGINGMSSLMHDFVNEHVVPVHFKNQDRPVAYNNWEATNFKFNSSKIKSLMKKASELGIELFILDDAWFSTRNDDQHGLGDWEDNTKKTGGILNLSKEAKKLGMKFGIWMEPEMVNDDTKTYKEHPEWVIKDKFHKPSRGRNQFVLNLGLKEVQDFVFESVSNTLKLGEISYLKWDYNRNITDYDNRNGTFYYDYITGLYSVLKRLILAFPDVLFENCASGGNRFDLGMLSYFAQSWMSDDTDSYQRTIIQEGGLLGYPLSVSSNHVAAKTSNQMLRLTSLDTKFNTACFGVLGYELDLGDLNGLDIKVIQNQIQYYKEHRHLLQFGKVYQDTTYIDHDEKMMEVTDGNTAIVAKYSKIQKPNPRESHLQVFGLNQDALYTYTTRQESIALTKFGNLVNYQTPFHVNPNGTLISILGKYIDMKSEIDTGVASGKTLAFGGPVLAQEWSGVGYDDKIRLMGDFGGRLYTVVLKNDTKK